MFLSDQMTTRCQTPNNDTPYSMHKQAGVGQESLLALNALGWQAKVNLAQGWAPVYQGFKHQICL